MSRLDRAYIWFFHFYSSDEALCPSCLTTVMSYESDWQKGHIIPARKPFCGPDIYENIRPICKDCNSKDKHLPSNYHYMVKIGKMRQEDLEPALKKIWTRDQEIKDHHALSICGVSVCSHNKIPHSQYCKHHRTTHIAIELMPIESIIRRAISELKNTFWDPEDLEAWRERKHIYAACWRQIKDDVHLQAILDKEKIRKINNRARKAATKSAKV